ncbi:MAG: Tm-1-like ATP-binding domain-containing protein [Balneolaceae bacterium]|nr:Tm-1-like ATP-binding domain-containing protein [Balneolaceae bacterium]
MLNAAYGYRGAGGPDITSDIPAEEVAKAGGSSLAQLRREADRQQAFEVMTKGIKELTPRLFEEGKFDGVLSLGGGSGTMMATAAMRELPLGVPKLNGFLGSFRRYQRVCGYQGSDLYVLGGRYCRPKQAYAQHPG